MILSDLRYAFRSLFRAPGFTIAVVLTLGLGIGANTAIFSAVRGVLLRPLPHRDGDRLMYLRQSTKGAGSDNGASQVDVGLVTGNYLSVMGLAPMIGHSFTDKDDGAGAAPVIMLGYSYWLNHFGGDRSVVGKSLKISGRSAEVVGVLQPAPFFPRRIDALMNMSISSHHVSAMMVQGRSHRMTEMIA